MSNIVPFGKYKGQPAETMAADRQYCEWLLSQPWAKGKLGAVYNIVINYGAEPQDTPEHNEMQARFLDDEFCLSVLKQVRPLWLDIKAQYEADDWELEKRKSARIERDGPVTVKQVWFEAGGWDVHASFGGGLRLGESYWGWEYGAKHDMFVECKPSLGDDYPAVLRQVQRYRGDYSDAKVVLVRRFSTTSVPLPAVRKIFAASGYDLVLEGECRL
jgi:uncharacterized protein (DUF3820 family)